MIWYNCVPIYGVIIPNKLSWAAGNINTIPLSGGHVPDPWEGNHWSSGQAGWYRPPWSYLDCQDELDGVLCHNRTPCCSDPRDGWVQVGVSFPPDGGGLGRDPTATRGGSGDIPGRGPSRRIQDGRPADGKDTEDRGVDVCAPIHSQWYLVRGAGMEGFPLPSLRHQSP